VIVEVSHKSCKKLICPRTSLNMLSRKNRENFRPALKTDAKAGSTDETVGVLENGSFIQA